MPVKIAKKGNAWSVSVKNETGKFVELAQTDQDSAEVIARFFNEGGDGCYVLQQAERGNPIARDSAMRLMVDFLGLGAMPMEPGQWSKWADLVLNSHKTIRCEILAREGQYAAVSFARQRDDDWSFYLPPLGEAQSGKKPDGLVVVGPLQYTLLIRGQGDPTRVGRGKPGSSTAWKAKIASPVATWKKSFLDMLSDCEPRTFHRLCVEIANIEGDTAGWSNAEVAIWQLTKEEKVEHTNYAPIFWRKRGCRKSSPPRMYYEVMHLPSGGMVFGALWNEHSAKSVLDQVTTKFAGELAAFMRCEPGAAERLSAVLGTIQNARVDISDVLML